MNEHMLPGHSAGDHKGPHPSSTLLREEGWTRRFTALGRRLEEAAELYRQLGFEVLLEPADSDEQASAGAESCRQCFVTAYARTIYTRPRTATISGEDSSMLTSRLSDT
jgi:uncharacterized alpha-E superfamily protein